MEKAYFQVEAAGKRASYPAGTKYGEIVKDFPSPDGYPVVLVSADGRIRELHKELERDCALQLITTGQPLGFHTYRRSMILLLLDAVRRTAGRRVEKAVLHYSVGCGYYFTIRENRSWSARKKLGGVKACMQELSGRALPIRSAV